jgi:hypothetical protein
MLTEVMLEINYYFVFATRASTATDPIFSFGVATLTDVLI